jgi:hypothetical protein
MRPEYSLCKESKSTNAGLFKALATFAKLFRVSKLKDVWLVPLSSTVRVRHSLLHYTIKSQLHYMYFNCKAGQRKLYTVHRNKRRLN